jgi:ABC-type multidrug transport system ATPase subunit
MNSYLQISNLTKRYGRTQALCDVNLSIQPCAVLALLGPNGAGKSTLFGCLLGLTLPSDGEFSLNGRAIADSERENSVTWLSALRFIGNERCSKMRRCSLA